VGRKNHNGSKSLRGTQVAALFYTLCESAKLVGVDPHTYLLTATEAALATPGTVTLPAAAAAYPSSAMPRRPASPRARARPYE
jgi:transposase